MNGVRHDIVRPDAILNFPLGVAAFATNMLPTHSTAASVST